MTSNDGHLTTTDMHPDAAATIRDELASIGTPGSRLQRAQRRTRVTASVVGVAAVALATSAAALVVTGMPGSTATDALGSTTTVTRTGPALVDIGRAPETAGAVIVDVTCLSDSGMVQVSTGDGTTGAGVSCSGDGQHRLHVVDGQLPAAGTTTFPVSSSPGTRWHAVLQYASSVTSRWSVNAKGQTFGIENQHGHPDLVPGRADDGRLGWVLWSETAGADQPGTVDVYESDGETVIGHHTAEAGTLPEVPLDQRYIDELNSVSAPATPPATPAPSPPSTAPASR
ncbi:hypothetical protein BIU98_07265 [Curtobacterium sp. MMLR14_010]|uniref:hypothetical protein n=1 Tax=Curtobacterium sp. MMLR14_010 TaxID=1898743 RepID=UPI0008DE69A7|nr:hypothetical protein [Curtobacterium sp. MMLR14_010]OII31572.1 hypothetical protein BIU98_07265 [Curtobacterium sp. MMLR14_010]